MPSTILMIIGMVIMVAGIADIETGWLRKIVRFPGKYTVYFTGVGIALLLIGSALQFLVP